VIEARAATDAESAAWLDDWRARLQAWYGRPDVPAEWASQQVEGRMAFHQTAPLSARSALSSGETLVGMLALSAAEQGGTRSAAINDIWIAPRYRRKGYGAEALRLAEDWARGQDATSIWVLTDPAEPAHAALFAGYPVRAHQMIRGLSNLGQLADGLTGRPMTDGEFADWRAASVRGYAADIAASGSLPAAQAAVAAAAEFDQLLPDGLNTADHSFLCLCADGEPVATNWIRHHRSPGTSWVYGVEVHEKYRGKGYGRAAMIAGEQATLDAGDTHLALNVFGHNDAAISLYQAMGYRAYDHGRSIDL
jgi:GNAT superfamily N-acetyltransferase